LNTVSSISDPSIRQGTTPDPRADAANFCTFSAKPLIVR
jgi:hypothetical protein